MQLSGPTVQGSVCFTNSRAIFYAAGLVLSSHGAGKPVRCEGHSDCPSQGHSRVSSSQRWLGAGGGSAFQHPPTPGPPCWPWETLSEAGVFRGALKLAASLRSFALEMPLKATGAPGLARLLCKDPGTQNRSLSSRQPVSSLCPQGGVLAAGEQAPCGRPGPPSPPKRNRIKDAEKLLQGSTFRLCPTGLIGVCVGPARQPPALLPRLSSVTPHPPPRALLSPLTQKVRSHRPQGSWCPGRSVREGPCPLEPSCGRQAGGGRHSNQGHAGTTASSKDGGGQLSGSSCSSVLPGDLFERGTLTSQASTASGPLGWALHMEGTFATLGGRGCGEPTRAGRLPEAALSRRG